MAIFSVGATFFSRPSSLALLSRYQKLGATVLRTDLAGAITITTDGRQYEVSTYRQAKLPSLPPVTARN